MRNLIKIKENPKQRRRGLVNWNLRDNLKFEARIRLKLSNGGWECLSFIVKKDMNAFSAALHEYLNLIFKQTESKYLIASADIPVQELPIIKNIKSSLLFGKTPLELKELDAFLKLYPNHDSLFIGPKIIGQLTDESEILKLKNIQISPQFGWNLLEVFTGRNIRLSEAEVITEAKITEIIRKWMASEKLQNLESLEFRFYMQNILPENVVESLETERFNPAVRPQVYHYDPKLVYIMPEDINLSGDNCYDVIRESDGKRATLYFDSQSFKLLVWN
ncbi:hypothetical protein CRE_14270 [Caenorhabditis remanei]|uniref:F-box associated domain-containing protein n=1 Tax=Caenorhabditis remanei TaxID=31234 RepID=E3N7N1_CAERE|nr:hypothetical protein CRE_14270 [Caenorhabditis remanei]